MTKPLVTIQKVPDHVFSKCFACGATGLSRTLFWFHPDPAHEAAGAHYVKLFVCERHRDQMINDLAACLESLVTP